MTGQPVIAVYDIGRTHKKFLLFDRQYGVVTESSTKIPDIADEDGYPCEDLAAIREWMQTVLREALQDTRYDIRSISFSAHGASLVHVGAQGQPVTPLYDYMKPLDPQLRDNFYALFNGRETFSSETGSPVLNMLNSGIQLYWLKHTRPEQFEKIRHSLHLPQYGNFLLSGRAHADITSIGCHTGLWDFSHHRYHSWVRDQQVDDRLPAPEAPTVTDNVRFGDKTIPVGIGLHDSSAALLPFVYTAQEPFILLSSGTWNISLHPFFKGRLTADDYTKDCLYYLLDKDQPVAASRVFLGSEYDHQVKKLEAFFQKTKGAYKEVQPDAAALEQALALQGPGTAFYPETMGGTGPFPELQGPAPDLGRMGSFETAYHKLMLDLTWLQKISLKLLSDKSPVNRLYLSGGFLQSELFMELLCSFLPGWQLFIAENKRASALGAALAVHKSWQDGPLPEDVTPLVAFAPRLRADLSSYRPF
ncbi:FGGY-family carbohydrate kinase [Compostibacter hankyongensis]|uniref:FGGY-family carbohydrate kinase n=1 Tax=Compostibacter hankyongensis TaxID=1007089 RepID=A0ABP8FFP5_9BACT